MINAIGEAFDEIHQAIQQQQASNNGGRVASTSDQPSASNSGGPTYQVNSNQAHSDNNANTEGNNVPSKKRLFLFKVQNNRMFLNNNKYLALHR